MLRTVLKGLCQMGFYLAVLCYAFGKGGFMKNLLILVSYLAIKFGGDGLWREISVYWSYLFEFLFVAVAAVVYRNKIQIKLPTTKLIFGGLAFSGIGGFSVYKSATISGIPIPFDLHGTETIFLLLILAPILEELVFRLALWENLKEIFKNNGVVLVLSALLFSFGHFIAYWSVPEDFQAFVQFQSFYVLLLGLGAGWARLNAGSFTGAIIIHFGFNFGFFLASRIS